MPKSNEKVLPTAAELALIVQDPALPADEKDDAMRQLAPTIEQIARRGILSPNIPWRMRDELITSAASFVWTRIDEFDPKRGRFESWCHVVLFHAFVDGVRSNVRHESAGEGTDKVSQEPVAAADDWGSDVERWMERRKRMREVLDEIAWQPTGTTKVHLYAVLLLRLRQGASKHVANVTETTTFQNDQLAAFIEWCLQWHSTEAELCFRPAHPKLREIWAGLKPKLSVPPHRVESLDVCHSVEALTKGLATISPSCWNQWARRAKKALLAKVDTDDWAELFSPLLPDRDATCTPTNNGGET